MNKKINRHSIISALIFIWIGFIGAISFMEAWLKFQAEGVTQKIGLSIGSLVFNALNKVEIVISVTILLVQLSIRNIFATKYLKKLLLPFSILVFQSIYLLPALDERAQLIIKNIDIKNSYDHIIYVFLEIIKMITLITIGIQILNKNEYK